MGDPNAVTSFCRWECNRASIQRPAPKMDSPPAPSIPFRSVPQSPAACPLPPPQSRSLSPPQGRSCQQLFQRHSQRFGIHRARESQLPFAKLDLNRAGGCSAYRHVACVRPCLGHANRQQSGHPLFPDSRSPWRYCRRQPNNWLAFTACARATRATDAPGARVSCTIWRFSSGPRCCLCASVGALREETVR